MQPTHNLKHFVFGKRGARPGAALQDEFGILAVDPSGDDVRYLEIANEVIPLVRELQDDWSPSRRIELFVPRKETWIYVKLFRTGRTDARASYHFHAAILDDQDLQELRYCPWQLFDQLAADLSEDALQFTTREPFPLADKGSRGPLSLTAPRVTGAKFASTLSAKLRESIVALLRQGNIVCVPSDVKRDAADGILHAAMRSDRDSGPLCGYVRGMPSRRLGLLKPQLRRSGIGVVLLSDAVREENLETGFFHVGMLANADVLFIRQSPAQEAAAMAAAPEIRAPSATTTATRRTPATSLEVRDLRSSNPLFQGARPPLPPQHGVAAPNVASTTDASQPARETGAKTNSQVRIRWAYLAMLFAGTAFLAICLWNPRRDDRSFAASPGRTTGAEPSSTARGLVTRDSEAASSQPVLRGFARKESYEELGFLHLEDGLEVCFARFPSSDGEERYELLMLKTGEQKTVQTLGLDGAEARTMVFAPDGAFAYLPSTGALRVGRLTWRNGDPALSEVRDVEFDHPRPAGSLLGLSPEQAGRRVLLITRTNTTYALRLDRQDERRAHDWGELTIAALERATSAGFGAGNPAKPAESFNVLLGLADGRLASFPRQEGQAGWAWKHAGYSSSPTELGAIARMSFSPDGSAVATLDSHGRIALWAVPCCWPFPQTVDVLPTNGEEAPARAVSLLLRSGGHVLVAWRSGALTRIDLQ